MNQTNIKVPPVTEWRVKLIYLFLIFLIQTYPQIKIRETVDLKKDNIILIEQLQKSTEKQNIRFEVSFAPYEYEFGNAQHDTVGHIQCNVRFYKNSNSIIRESGYVRSGPIKMDIDVSNPQYPVSYKVDIKFNTSLGHTAYQYNSGGAGVVIKVYLNDELLNGHPIFIDEYRNRIVSVYVKYVDLCDLLEECTEIGNIPEINFELHQNGYANYDICLKQNRQGGFSIPGGSSLLDKKLETFEVCYNKGDNHWKYNTDNPVIHLIKDICIQNISNHFKYQLKNSVNDVSDNEICQAIKDLEEFKNYGKDLGKGAIAFKDLFLEHENFHFVEFRDNYIFSGINNLNQELQLLNNKYKCSDFKDKVDAKNTMLPEYINIVTKHISEKIKAYTYDNGISPYNFNKYMKEENNNHNKILDSINRYITLLEKRKKSLGIICK